MAFYLGKKVGTESADGAPERVEYKPKHLTTHGLVFGMTGSGKTGLCIGMLEEASRHDIPVIAIDPKGDIANLALSWPDLAPAKFGEWVDPSKLEGGRVSRAELGEKMSGIWRGGITGDGQTTDQIQELRQRTNVTVFTPGSSAGVQVSMLSRFDPPPRYESLSDEDKSELIGGIVSAVLALMDMDADSMQSPEYILMAKIIEHAWTRNETLDLPSLIKQVYTPPFTTMGVFDLEDFYPEKKRKAFAMKLNSLIASPQFAPWLKGEPLDVEALLRKDPGGSRTSIFYIAHLSDNERMSFVSLLLDRIIAWMRAQPGTGDLRALVYFDEVFGYLPPHPKNPPTKRPLLTILKQARAFGLGALLATQNPVDIDYKAITNAGTWLVGKLQTEQDKERILDGLMGASGGGLSRSQVSKAISALEGRQFLIQNAHTSDLQTFKTRFVFSYLRGPMTKNEIERLKAVDFYNSSAAKTLAQTAAPAAPARPQPAEPAPAADEGKVVGEIVDDGPEYGSGEVVEIGDPSPSRTLQDAQADMLRRAQPAPAPTRSRSRRAAAERFLSSAALDDHAVRRLVGLDTLTGAGPVRYRGALLAEARLTFSIAGARDIEAGFLRRIVYPIPVAGAAVDWRVADAPLNARHFGGEAISGAEFTSPPAWVKSRDELAIAERNFIDTLIHTQRSEVPVCPPLGKYGMPGESLDAFRTRLGAQLTDATDSVRDKLYGRRSVEAQLWDKQLEEMRELLEMDKRELNIVKRQGDTDELMRVRDRAKFRLERYKELKKTRDMAVGEVDRDITDAEFAAIDKLEACKMSEMSLSTKGINEVFVGVLWFPNR